MTTTWSEMFTNPSCPPRTRGAVGVSDRGITAAAALAPGDIDWEHVFGGYGSRWFRTGGIFAGLSETTAQVTLEAVQSAKRHGG